MERGRALGINVAVAYIGLSTGPFIGGMMTHQWGWRSIFVLSLPIALVGFVLGWKNMTASQRSDEDKSFDLWGSVIYVAVLALSDRHDPRWLASFGMAVTGSCLFAFSLLHIGSTLLTIVVILMVMGSGFAFFVAPNNNAIVSSVGAEQYDLASGILATGRILGMSMSMAITTMILNIMSGSNAG